MESWMTYKGEAREDGRKYSGTYMAVCDPLHLVGSDLYGLSLGEIQF